MIASKYLRLVVLGVMMGCAEELPPPQEESLFSGLEELQLAAMQGRWQSIEDPRYAIEIHGSNMKSLYDGGAVDEEEIVLSTACDPAAEEVDEAVYFMTRREGDLLCYGMLMLEEDDVLSYSLLARGNTTLFNRIE